MLDYIRNEISRRQQEEAAKKNQEIDDETILEYAHLFQELDDLTVSGTQSDQSNDETTSDEPMNRGLSNRKMEVNIPVDDDNSINNIEVDTIEYNMNTGLVQDVPADATIQESVYAKMKTYEDFYQEASHEVPRFARESNEMYERRVQESATEKFDTYKADITERGLFGFDRINLSDSKVPSKVNVDLGSIEEGSNNSFVTKLKVFFDTDKNGTISKRQLDSVNYIKQNNSFHNIGKALATYMESMNIPLGSSSLWDNITPVRLIVPSIESQSLCVVLEYFDEYNKKTHYYGWTHSFEGSDETENAKLNHMSFYNESATFVNKDSYVESTNTVDISKYSRFTNDIYQEAITMGDDAQQSATDDTTVGAANGDDMSVDMGDASTTNTDMNTDASATDDTTPPDPDATPVETNDVSDEIADKVAEKTADAIDVTDDMSVDTSNLDASLNDDGIDDGEVDNDDVNIEDTDVDNKLNELNDMGTSDMENDVDAAGTVNPEDIDNMTMDELLEKGNEKLKGMTIQQFKQFLNSDDVSTDDFQEAFFPTLGLSAKNVYSKMNKTIQDSLGILNSKEQLKVIIKKFKSKGKDLNKIITKALKIKNAYTESEKSVLNELNKSLISLMQMIKENGESDADAVKRLITDYGDKCKKVAAINEKHDASSTKSVNESAVTDNNTNGEIVQEGLFLSPKNVRKRLVKKMTPVYVNLNSLKKNSDSGTNIIPRVIKMYKPKKGMSVDSTGDDFGYNDNYVKSHRTSTDVSEYNIETAASINLSRLIELIDKILKKSKVQKSFSSKEFELIQKLSDQADDFVAMIEDILFDNAKDEGTTKMFIKKLNELIATMDEMFDVCDGEKPMTKRGLESDDTVSVDDGTDENDEIDELDKIDEGDEPDEDDESDDVTTEAYNQGIGSLQNDVKQALGTKYEITNAGWNGEFKITNKDNPSTGIKVKPSQNNTVSVFEIDENGIEKVPAIKNNASLSTRRSIIDAIIEFFKKSFGNIETESALMKDLGIVIDDVDLNVPFDTHEEYMEYMEAFSTFDIEDDEVVQEVNYAGAAALSLIAPPIGAIVSISKISNSNRQLYQSLIDITETLKSKESMKKKQLIKALKKVADNCRWSTYNVFGNQVEKRNMISKLRDATINFANVIKANADFKSPTVIKANKEFNENVEAVIKILN